MKFLNVLTVLALVCVPAAAQDDNNEIDEAIKGLGKAIKERIPADQVHYAKVLADKWDEADPKQRKRILKAMAYNFRTRSTDVLEQTAESLGKMGGGEKQRDAKMATKILVQQTENKVVEDNPAVFRKVVAAIGQLGHPDGSEGLIELLKYHKYEIVGAAGGALANYKESPLRLRKEIVKELLKRYTSIESAADDPRDSTAKERLRLVKGPFESTLKALTGRDITGATRWWSWWNDEGKRAREW